MSGAVLPFRTSFLNTRSDAAEPLSGNAESLVEMHTRAILSIDRTTITPNRDGAPVDVDHVPSPLLQKRITPAA
jgi:hypothetical protein